MTLYTYTIEQASEWDKVVKSFALHDVYYLVGYVKAFQIHGDGEPMLFYFEGENVRGINVVMKRDISDDARFAGKIEKNKYFDLITPYGYGGWLIEGNGNRKELFDSYQRWCQANNVVCEFVRFNPVLNNFGFSQDYYEVVHLGNTIAMDLSSTDTIWANLTSQNRNMVRKARKSGVEIKYGQAPEMYEIFRDIYNQTMDSNNADSYYYFSDEFYKSVVDDLNDKAQMFWAVYDDTVIAASIMIGTNGFLNYHLSGSLREFKNLAPTNLILYEAAKWGSENGYKTLHLGGGVGSREDGLYKFKSSFNRNANYRFSIGKKIFIEEIYQELLSLRTDGPQNNLFPQYRA